MSAYDEGGGYEDFDEGEGKESPATEGLLSKEAEGKDQASKSPQSATSVDCCCLLWSVIWLAVLVAFAWPFSVAMSAIYGFVAPLITLIGLDDISDSMLQAVHVGRECARNVRTGRPIG
ncbi:hypothetical protein JRQ81_000850 [Phrynocephalus forsythii]|uniref:Uncharacterized protein n=1 Tax=Phrynocephalus forsythii TaxID=171643 RepID=A0A9Q0Y621_9SAUR|nr:hypothetical protein JRQ81_000850 [Phrynocephalus forsythii]